MNLVNNGIKFTERGNIAIRVSLEQDGDADVTIRFSVADTGIGIPADRMDRLFKSFSQIDASMTRKYGGTGLGLAISKQLAEVMGGQIGVASEEGKGSTFWFTVRLKKQRKEHDTRHRVPAPEPADIPGALKSHIRILLVEDNEVNQLVALSILKRLGFNADVTENGLEALDALKTEPYDIVFMDVQMPEMDGLDATKAIRDPQSKVLNPDIPIIAMTAHAAKEDRDICFEAGMNDYLSKPIQPQRLLDTIAKHFFSQADPKPEPQKEATPQGEILDKSRLADFGYDESFFEEILAEFLAEAPSHINNVKEALQSGDAEKIRHEAHSLKGMAANLGAQRLAHAAHKLEIASKNNDNGKARILTEDLEAEFDQLVSLLPEPSLQNDFPNRLPKPRL